MSGKLVGWAMEQVTGSPVTKLVLVKLADNANETGYCCASIELIVKHTELSERAVRKHLHALEQKSLIRIERRRLDGVQIRSLYHLNASGAGVLHDVQSGVHAVQGGSAPRAGGYGTTCRAIGDKPATEPAREQENKILGIGTGKNGKKFSTAVTIPRSEDRLSRFQQKLAPVIGPDGWLVLAAATDAQAPNHLECLAKCKEAARKLGKGWPRQWPTSGVPARAA